MKIWFCGVQKVHLMLEKYVVFKIIITFNIYISCLSDKYFMYFLSLLYRFL